MKENKLTKSCAIRWRMFNRKGYSAFSSLKKEVNIGVLTVCTLGFAHVDIVSVPSDTPAQQKNKESDEIGPVDVHALQAERQFAKTVATVSRGGNRAVKTYQSTSYLFSVLPLPGVVLTLLSKGYHTAGFLIHHLLQSHLCLSKRRFQAMNARKRCCACLVGLRGRYCVQLDIHL